MPRTIVSTSDAAAPPPFYSQAVICAGLVFVSGTAPHDPTTGRITGVTVQEQTAQCLRNIAAILAAAGSSLDKAVSATVILAEEGDLATSMKNGSNGFRSIRPRGRARGCRSRFPGCWCRSR
ncbi:MAG: Rid family hydrolase [Sphingomonas sp.]